MGGQGSHLVRCKSGGTRDLNVTCGEQISGMQVQYTRCLCNAFEITSRSKSSCDYCVPKPLGVEATF
jgi:hypothetical protein